MENHAFPPTCAEMNAYLERGAHERSQALADLFVWLKGLIVGHRRALGTAQTA